MADLDKTAVWFVYDDADNRVRASWLDAPPPAYRVSVDGPDGFVVRLPWIDGADQAVERGLGWHRRADCYTATPDSQASAYGVDLYNAGLYGDGGTYGAFTSSGGGIVGARARSGLIAGGDVAYGSAAGPGRLVYRGLIEEWALLPDDRAIEVAVIPISRRADTAYLPDGATYSGDLAAIARSVTESYGAGLTWAAANPARAGTSVSVDLSRLSVREALSRLRDLAGGDWLAVVTPQGMVRFFDPAAAPTDHRLIAGLTARSVRILSSGARRRRLVRVVWSGGAATAQAVDYDGADPAEEQIAAGEVGDAGTAQRLAEAMLAALDRIEVQGTATVTAAYDVDTLAVGDLVAITAGDEADVLAASDTYGGGLYGDGGTYGTPPGAAPLIIAGIDYQFTEAVIELTRPRPRASRVIEDLARRARAAELRAI